MCGKILRSQTIGNFKGGRGLLDRRRRRPANGIFRHKLTRPFRKSSSMPLMFGVSVKIQGYIGHHLRT
jgi:hypothetical protein